MGYVMYSIYADLSSFWRWANRLSLGVAWFSGVMVGVSALLNPPQTVTDVQPGWISVTWGVLTVLGSLVALYGSVLAKYQIEGVGSWVAGSGVVAYMLTVWSLVWAGSDTRMTQAWAMTALFSFVLARAVSCGSHAYRVRMAHRDVTGE